MIKLMHSQSQSGMTVPELVVAITVTALLSTVLLVFMTDNLRTSSKQFARQELLSDARIGLDKVANEIRRSSVTDSSNRWNDTHAPGAPLNPLSWTSNGTTLVLASSAVHTSGNVMFDDALNYVTLKNNVIFFTRDGILYRRTLAAPTPGNSAKTTCPAANASASCPADAIVMRNVSEFTVRYINADDAVVAPSDARAIELKITLSDDVFGEAVSASYTTRMVFRNG